MNGRHQPTQHPNMIMQWFDQRGQTIGGTRRVRNDGVTGFQYAVVHSVDHSRINIFATWCRDNDFSSACCEMRTSFFLAGEKPCALQDHVDSKFAPGKLGGIALREHSNPSFPNHKVVFFDGNRLTETTVGRVVLKQMGVRICIAKIVHSGHFKLVLFS